MYLLAVLKVQYVISAAGGGLSIKTCTTSVVRWSVGSWELLPFNIFASDNWIIMAS